MGAGRKHHEDGNFLTDRQTLRTVDTADADVDAVEEVLDTRVDSDDRPGNRGHQTTIALFVLLDGPLGATVQLWGYAAAETDEGGSSSLSSGTSEWCQYVEQAVTKNTMLVYPQMPAGEYKVVVSSITGSGDVIVREAHSA